MFAKNKRLTFADKELLKLPEENFISSVEYSWEEKWKEYNYSKREKTFLILKNLERALELRQDIVDAVFEKLHSLNNEEEVKHELEELYEQIYKQKKTELAGV